MPAQYERIKESYLKRGKPLKTAKKLAAMTYNAHRPSGAAPVGPHYDEKHGLIHKQAAKKVADHLTAARKAASRQK